MVARRPIRRTGKVSVAKPAATAMGRQPTLVFRITVKQQLVSLRIKNLGPHRYADNDIGALFTGTIAALSVQTATGNMQRVITQVQERIQRRVPHDPHVTAATSVTSRGTAAGHKLFAPKGGHTVAAVTTLDANLDAIDK